jgi:hypothetical protein
MAKTVTGFMGDLQAIRRWNGGLLSRFREIPFCRAHQLVNRSDFDVLYLEVGDRTAGKEGF